MNWDILILTMPTRKEFLRRLLTFLNPQLVPQVRVLIRMCDPHLTLGENRELLRRESSAEYISWVDDDDLISPHYVRKILPLLDGVDQIGFECEVWKDSVRVPKRDFHTLSAGSWHDTESSYYRDISHLQPMRRELSLLEPMEGGHGEDKRWADRMRGKVNTEHYIDDIMYYYLFRSNKTFAEPCPKCKGTITAKLEDRTQCNQCGNQFEFSPRQKSCLWT